MLLCRGGSVKGLVLALTARVVLLVAFPADIAAGSPPDPAPERLQAFLAATPKEIFDLQMFRSDQQGAIVGDQGQRGTATLIDLNPAIHTWYVLQLRWDDGTLSRYHLQTARPGPRLELDAAGGGIVVIAGKQRSPCPLWSSPDGLASVNARRPYSALCDGRVFVRSTTVGHKSSKEWATDFLRDYVPGGESITGFVRDFYKDALATTGEVSAESASHQPRPQGAPARPDIDEAWSAHVLHVPDLGIAVPGVEDNRFLVGSWYPTRMPAVYVTALQPRLVSTRIAERQTGLTKPLDDIEKVAMVYIVAFDLERYNLGYALGTEHPRLDWSTRAPAASQNAALPGPDGIADSGPLVRTGMLDPVLADFAVATFAGGFKRYHGAFRYGELSRVNGASHYGFMESGTLFSRLQPGLATAVVWDDGTFDLLTWKAGKEADLARMRHARQNGVALIEPDPATGIPRVGALVGSSNGNWSGAVDGRYRTVRGGVALQESGGRRFLLYAYFSAATPSAMARVFEAFGVRYAMLTDMNALEHTYMALYNRDGNNVAVEHLVRGMEVLDKTVAGQVLPRFIGFADNRDFFYLFPKGE